MCLNGVSRSTAMQSSIQTTKARMHRSLSREPEEGVGELAPVHKGGLDGVDAAARR